MLLSFNEAVKEYGNQYQLSQALAQQKVYKIEEGIYSTDKYVSEVVTVMKKYPKAVLTGEYAFYFHGLTDIVPEKYDIATPSKSARLKDDRIRQIYVRDDIFSLGIEEKEVTGGIIRIYDKERMLIELLRNMICIKRFFYITGKSLRNYSCGVYRNTQQCFLKAK